MIPGSANPLLLKSAAAAGGLQISRSIRLNSADSAYLNRTYGSPTTQNTFTWAGWVKLGALGTTRCLFGVSTNHSLGFTTGDALNLTFGGTSALTTTTVFRDPSAWYHIVWTQSATSHTLYVNNVSVGTATATSSVFNTAVAHQIGAANTANYFNGYLANIHFIDGQALTPSSFTETDATTGQLIPKTYSGSYGTNGFNLLFADNSSNTASTLGKDYSGLGNNWTPVNFSTSTGGPTSVAAASGALPIYNTTDTYGATKGTGTRTDSNSSSIVLAVAMDGTNGGTTFTDESATIKGSGSPKSITNSNVTTVTSQSKFYGSSGFFNSSSDNLVTPAGSDFAYGTGDLTWECWVYPTSYPNTYIQVLWSQDASGVNYLAIGLLGSYFGTSGQFAGLGVTSSYVVPLNQWTHLAAVRSSGTVTLYVNGVSVSSASNTTNFTDTSRNPSIGGYPWDTGSNFYGYIQDVRVYKGVAKYTGNFNPPSSTQNPTIAAGNDSLVDTPTNYGTDTGVGGEVRGNYATLNNLLNTNGTYANGNLEKTQSDNFGAISTICPSSGKWYAEFAYTAIGSASAGVIVTNLISASGANGLTQTWQLGYISTGKLETAGSQSNVTGFTTNDVIGVAFDCATGAATFYKNGSSIGTATSSAFISVPVGIGSATGGAAGSNTVVANFGQRAFAYPVSGFKALCTQNLPEGTITTSGSFTGNANADGPFVYLNGVPTAMTINSNAVTFATHADKLSNGFKLRTSSGSYNTAGSNTYSITTTGAKFKYAPAQPNP